MTSQQPPEHTELRDVDPPPLPAQLLARHRATVLDPTTAARQSGAGAPRPAAYLTSELLVPGGVLSPDSDQGALLQRVLGDLGVRGVPDPAGVRLADRLRNAETGTPHAVRLRLEPATDEPSAPVDAWPVLMQLRHAARQAGMDTPLPGVGLNHLLFGATTSIGGLPFVNSHSVPEGLPFVNSHAVTDGAALAEYAVPGHGGRAPVSWVGPGPAPRAIGCRPPVIGVLDSGVGAHPWLGAPHVDTAAGANVVFNGITAGLTDPATDPERTGDVVGPMDGALDSHAGHGTFICGLLRQLCPEAHLLPIRVMGGDGVVEEHQLITALAVLHSRLVAALRSGSRHGLLDVLVLALGYYHEIPEDAAFDSTLLPLLAGLGELGVAVVAAAGNDGTSRPMYPAAFTPYPGGPVSRPAAGAVPLVSVGGRNPAGPVALFSNDGPWVAAWDKGASLVSTLPTTFDGGVQPTVRTHARGKLRTSIDLDDYRGGFATWSGTSFAAPVLAGRIAAALLDAPPGTPVLDEPGAPAAVERGWAAVSAVTGIERPVGP